MFAHKHMYKDPLGRTHTNLKLLLFAKVRLISDYNTMPFHLLAGLKCMKMPRVKSHFFILLSSQTKHLRADKSFNDQPLLFSTTEKKHLLESRGHKSQTNFTSNTNHLEIFQPPSRKRCACRIAERVLSEHTWLIYEEDSYCSQHSRGAMSSSSEWVGEQQPNRVSRVTVRSYQNSKTARPLSCRTRFDAEKSLILLAE